MAKSKSTKKYPVRSKTLAEKAKATRRKAMKAGLAKRKKMSK